MRVRPPAEAERSGSALILDRFPTGESWLGRRGRMRKYIVASSCHLVGSMMFLRWTEFEMILTVLAVSFFLVG